MKLAIKKFLFASSMITALLLPHAAACLTRAAATPAAGAEEEVPVHSQSAVR